jgi:hypothetical protein
MLDIGGTIECRVYQYDSGFFQIYILASTLGIEPGDTFLANDKFLKPYRDIEGEWYVKLYTNSVRKKNRHKRKYKRVDRITDEVLAESIFYNEMVRIGKDERENNKEKWFTQNVKASIILPIIKERSKIPNSLIYVDEYWKT